MKILFLADLHYSLPQYDWIQQNASQYDLVVMAGDLADMGSQVPFDVQIVVIGRYLERISRDVPVAVCSGNHDLDGEDGNGERAAVWLRELDFANLILDGQDRPLGAYTVTVCAWANSEQQAREVGGWLEREASEGRPNWIWVHHEPPAGSRTAWTGKADRGSAFLRDWILKLRPFVVCCGHIHNAPFYRESGWWDRLGASRVFNPGRQLGSVPCYISFDLENKTAYWRSNEGEETVSLAD